MMKPLISIAFVAFFQLRADFSVLAQTRLLRSSLPDYSTMAWKEYSFTHDNIRFKFAVERKRKDSVTTTVR